MKIKNSWQYKYTLSNYKEVIPDGIYPDSLEIMLETKRSERRHHLRRIKEKVKYYFNHNYYDDREKSRIIGIRANTRKICHCKKTFYYSRKNFNVEQVLSEYGDSHDWTLVYHSGSSVPVDYDNYDFYDEKNLREFSTL